MLINKSYSLIPQSDMEIIEHHHHDQINLFLYYKTVIPFSIGASIVYNYLDYRLKNNINIIYQLIIYITDEYLCG